MVRRYKALKAVQFFFIFLLVLCAICYGLYSASLGKKYPIQGEKQLFSVNQGDTYTALIDRLALEKKVYFPQLLKLYRKAFIHDTLKAGVYELRQGVTVQQVLDMMSNADNAQMNKVMVIDGTTSRQLLQRLKQDVNVKQVVSTLTQEKMLKQLNIPYSSLEGFLAPNTYFYAKGETDEKILLDLYHRQNEILKQEWEKRAPNLPYKNEYEALIMASIIEKETSLERELTQVSGVFVRRLQQGMRLQTDPTVIYGMAEKYQGKITKQDLRTPTLYNTYTIAGLPPTPIALPGRKAIHAALHPDDAKNVYFVATGNGGHQFSETLEQHNQAVQAYLAVLRAKREGATS